jgi:hypothetical protein
MYKLAVKATIVFLIYYGTVILCFLFVAQMNALDPAGATVAQTINDYLMPVNIWTLISDLVWFIPTLILIPRYYHSIEYSVKAESGDTMPDIYSMRGSSQ